MPASDQGLARDETSEGTDSRAPEGAWRLEHTLETAHIGAWDLDLADHTARRTLSHDRIFGYETLLPRWTYEDFLAHVLPEDRAEVDRVFRRAVGARSDWDFECRIRRRDGEVRWIWAAGQHGTDERGHARVAGIVQDITDRKRSEEALRVSEARYRLLHESLRDAFVQTDLDGRLVAFNDHYVRMLGYAPAELLALTYQELTPERWHAVEAGIVRDQILPRGYSDVYEKEYRRKDGTLVPVELRAILGRRADGQPNAMWAIVRDITERKRLEEERRRAEEEVRAADRHKSEFLAVLSHELRNPLAPIRNAIHLLELAPPGSPQALRAVDVLRRQSGHLARLVDDLLDVTRIGRGKVHLQRARLDLRDVVRKAADDLRPTFDQRGVALHLEHSAGPCRVTGDPVRLAQVASNLLNNAAKFTPPGGTVLVALSSSAGHAALAVRDTGIGMEPGEVARMFEPFAQAGQGPDRTHGGLGLGLALVKGLVELHGGSVRASSPGPGLGAEFVVELPLAGPEATPAPPAPAPAPGTGFEVVVIEDNPDAAGTLAALLELAGHRVRVATEGRAGLALVRELRPDVIFCDIGLPDLSGHEVARAVRADPALARTRLVALTGYAQAEDRRQAAEAGFDAHLAKPPSLEQLWAALGSAGEPA